MQPVRIESLEHRVLCRVTYNGDFVITPPGGGEALATLHVQPEEGLVGVRTAEANSGGPSGPVVNWEITTVHEWTPGDPGGPHAV